MSSALRRPMSLQAFLAWEERQELRFEFDGFEPVAMTGGSAAHGRILRNVVTALTTRLRGRPCQPFGSDMKILLAGGSIRYPDAFVVCVPVPDNATVVTEPTVVFEVLSPGTSRTDRIVKNREYRDTPSIRRYVILEQSSQAATVFTRAGDDWIGHLLTGDAVLEMPDIGISIPLAELYEDLTFPMEE